MLKQFEGQIQHNEQTIKRLFKAAYYTYDIKRAAARLIAGALLAVLGAIGNFSFIVQGGLMMLGCWLIVSGDFPSKCRAERVLENRKYELPRLTTAFYDEYAQLKGEGQMKLEYTSFQVLLEQEDYLFLFVDKHAVCMIDVQTLKPYDIEAFKKFVTKKTGLEWRKSKNLFSMNLSDLLRLLRGQN